MQSRPLTVLHVTESYGAGVASAIHQYASSTPELQHHLLRHMRPDFVEAGERAAFSSVTEFAPTPLQAARTLRRLVNDLDPDVLHAHSSLAGVIVRTGLRNRHPVPIVYTPHGFASERLDVGRVSRAAFRSAEWLMSWNTELVVACSRREERVARHGRARRGAVLVPNVAPADVGTVPRAQSNRNGVWKLVGAGRLGPQKDPGFFIEVLEKLRNAGADVDAVWVGDGLPGLRETLERHAVHVTGWRPRRQALELLASADAYLHASAWDSGPLTLLEASALGVPTIARRSPSMFDLPSEVSSESPEGAARLLVHLMSQGRPAAEANLAAWRHHFRDNTTGHLRQALLGAYEGCLDRSGGRRGTPGRRTLERKTSAPGGQADA